MSIISLMKERKYIFNTICSKPIALHVTITSKKREFIFIYNDNFNRGVLFKAL